MNQSNLTTSQFKDILFSEQLVSKDVLKEKYAKNNEKTKEQIYLRVAEGVASAEKTQELKDKYKDIFYKNMLAGAIGAGRIMANAGSAIGGTWINCFVQPIGDCITGSDKDGNPGIYTAISLAAETMRRGGGVGYDFSLIRPKNSQVKGTSSFASGPCSYINVFDASCDTVESAGARRGAQLAALRVDHPDINEYIVAKRTEGRWNKFNVSVFVSDTFMEAVEKDLDWQLIHKAEPSNEQKATGAFQREDGKWVYQTVKAKDLWDTIMKSNYDFAEPGVLFEGNINRDNNLRYVEYIAATNPCVTKDMWTHTSEGPKQVKDLIDSPYMARVNGEDYLASSGFFKTGTKSVYLLETHGGPSIKVTKDHLILVELGNRKFSNKQWLEAGFLSEGDLIVLHNHRKNIVWPGKGNKNQGYLLGALVGDGYFSKDSNSGHITAYENGNPSGIISAFSAAAEKSLKVRSDHKGWSTVISRDGKTEYRYESSDLKKLANEFGLVPDKELSAVIETSSSDFYLGFLNGIFDTDGTIGISKNGTNSIRLSQSNHNTLVVIQRMLARLGIVSKIHLNRREAGQRILPDGKGSHKFYNTKANHELIISKDNIRQFIDIIGFNDTSNAEKINRLNNSFYTESFTVEFKSLTYLGEEDVYDTTVPGPHAFDCNGVYIHNCGEQPLPPYGCCDLGPIILTNFVNKPFTSEASFDFIKFQETIIHQVRFLDNVLDATYWPLEEQKKESASKRRIGVGFTGLGNALAMLGLHYDSKEALDMASHISRFMCTNAYLASVELAKEKGPFPLFDADKYLEEGTFASRLDHNVKQLIRIHGIRNSHLLSIAPTGTVSLAFADNASNGIEPPFSFYYTRKKRNQDGGFTYYDVLDHGFKEYLKTLPLDFAKALFEAVKEYKENFTFINTEYKVKEQLHPAMVTALELSTDAHMNMLAVVQPYIDSSISKTVNVPEDYPFDDFKHIYLKAYKANLKGLATYRPNNILGSVLSVGKKVNSSEAKPLEPTAAERYDAVMETEYPKRPSGRLYGCSDKYTYYNSEGEVKFYVGVSFIEETIKDITRDILVKRPIELFINSEMNVGNEWGKLLGITLSQMARISIYKLSDYLKTCQKMRSDRGSIRFGNVVKPNGGKAPKYHGSDIAVMAYAIQELLYQEGIFDKEGNPVKFENKSDSKTNSDKVESVDEESVSDVMVATGSICSECGAPSVIKKDGCKFCTNCGAEGGCG